jgi:hypothetical protein
LREFTLWRSNRGLSSIWIKGLDIHNRWLCRVTSLRVFSSSESMPSRNSVFLSLSISSSFMESECDNLFFDESGLDWRIKISSPHEELRFLPSLLIYLALLQGTTEYQGAYAGWESENASWKFVKALESLAILRYVACVFGVQVFCDRIDLFFEEIEI